MIDAAMSSQIRNSTAELAVISGSFERQGATVVVTLFGRRICGKHNRHPISDESLTVATSFVDFAHRGTGVAYETIEVGRIPTNGKTTGPFFIFWICERNSADRLVALCIQPLAQNRTDESSGEFPAELHVAGAQIVLAG